MQASPADVGSSPGFSWNDQFRLGLDLMDEAHHEFVALVDQLLTCGDETVPDVIGRFHVHLRRHFDEESTLMSQTSFPSASCHLDEHGAVLQSVTEVVELVKAGNIEIARSLANELARWFPTHVESMDLGLAQWVVKQRLGGAPVLVRRASR